MKMNEIHRERNCKMGMNSTDQDNRYTVWFCGISNKSRSCGIGSNTQLDRLRKPGHERPWVIIDNDRWCRVSSQGMLDAERSTYAMLAKETPKDRREICEGNELETYRSLIRKSARRWLGPCKESE